ncbi:MAG: hypothetical protein R3229_15010 [Alphaproteobacteria bacterium]|nr:hypothetical protein [Alphaproteobacteria bacterium]
MPIPVVKTFLLLALLLGAAAPFATGAAAKPLCPSKQYGESLPCRLEIISFVDVIVPSGDAALEKRVPAMKALIRERLKAELPFIRHEDLDPDRARRTLRDPDQLRKRGGFDCSILTADENGGSRVSLLVQCLLWSYAQHPANDAVLNIFHARQLGMAPRKEYVKDIDEAIARNVQKIADSFKTTRMIYSKQAD